MHAGVNFVAKSLKMQDSEGRKFDNVSSLAFRVLSSDAKLLLCGVPCSAQGPEQPSHQLPSVLIPGQRKLFLSHNITLDRRGIIL
jgi:hypothetical protein